MAVDTKFVPALIIVDFQEDFCPPHGSLAVPSGRDIALPINQLLKYHFEVKVATKDFHPPAHISFASNHPNAEPFSTSITIPNPYNSSETQVTRLWPDHCIQGTTGADFVPELDQSRVDAVIEKGQDPRVEQYSAFGDPFESPAVSRTGLTDLLKDRNVTHLFVTGLAMDYCVKFTALDGVKEGFNTVIVEEATRAVDTDQSEQIKRELLDSGVKIVSLNGEEVKRVMERQSSKE